MKIAFIAATCLAAFATTALADSNPSGKTITRKNKEGQRYTTTYYANGTTFTKSRKMDGSCCDTSPGTWHMENGRVCETYANWRNGNTWCH
jgi:hypothetical protein